MIRKSIPVLALAALTLAGHRASAGLLSLGDAAPPIKVGGWAKGVPVTAFAPGKVYVIEFWATWCGPCKATALHLTALNKKYAGKVTFAGVDVWEKGDDPLAKVKAYVANEGPKMAYKVAFDTADGAMGDTWMKASGQAGLPTAFIVQDGKVMWIGQPNSSFDTALDQVVVGTYDVAKARADADAKIAAANAGAKTDETATHEAFEQAMAAKDYSKALTIIEGFIANHPNLEPLVARAKLGVLFLIDKSKALAYADTLGAKAPAIYDDVAVMLLHDSPLGKADPATAVIYAKKADDGFEGKQPNPKIVLAQAYKVNGQLELAEATFKAGIDMAKQQGAKQDIIDLLTKAYEDTK